MGKGGEWGADGMEVEGLRRLRRKGKEGKEDG